MAQTPATRFQTNSGYIDYTPGSAVTAGNVIVQGAVVGIATSDIAASALGGLAIEGVFKCPKITGAIAVGTKLYWDPAGDPVGGTAGSGAVTATAGTLKCIGYAALAAVSGDATVPVSLSRA